MEYQKVINLLDDILNQSSKFRTRNLIEINDASWETRNVSNQVKIKISMIRSIYVIIKMHKYKLKELQQSQTQEQQQLQIIEKKVIFKTYTPFTNCISAINDTHLDDAHDVDVVMPMYSLIEYSGTYLKMSGSLWQYYGDEPTLNNNVIIDFTADNNNSISFKFEQQITGQTGNNETNDIEVKVTLKYLSNF